MQVHQPESTLVQGTESSPLEICLFGAFSLRVRGVEAARLSRQAQSVLALLAVRRQSGTVSRVWLAETIWPDAVPERAAFYLRRSLTELRAALGAESGRLATTARTDLSFDFSEASCDVIDFGRLSTSRQEWALERAVALFRGPFLGRCNAPWIPAERAHFSERYRSALEILAQIREERGDIDGALDLIQTAVKDDPLRESARRAMMRLRAANGDLAGMERQYRELRDALRQAFQMEPGAETSALYQRLRARSATTKAPARDPSATSARVIPLRSFPQPLTSLVGRREEREQVRAALQGGRLVTLVGPGGVGKTRLALFVADSAAELYPAGVCFVDMSAAISDTEALRATVAALNISSNGQTSLRDALMGYLQTRSLLLIVDNAEHIADACAALIDDLLRACPSVVVLCTSRQPLFLAGEIVLPVMPLALPEPAASLREGHGERVPACDSVQLLLDRIRAAAPAFRLSPEEGPLLADICRALDGLPLALELVAIRFRSLSPREIASRLDIRLRLLTGGSPALSRHRTLHAALDWSYDLLDEAEQRLLLQLSVFRGGWTLEAAEAVCAWDGQETDVLLAALVDKSLVICESQEVTYRYRLLETTRQYVEERWEDNKRISLQERHAAHFYELARSADAAAAPAQFPSKPAAFPEERDNFGAAHGWLLQCDPEKALWLELYMYATTLWPLEDLDYWLTRLEVTRLGQLRLRILEYAGRWALWRNHADAEQTLRRLLTEAEAASEPVLQMQALDLLSIIEMQRGDLMQAWRSMEEVLRLQPADLAPYYQSRNTAKAAVYLGRVGEVEEAIRRLDAQIAAERQRGEWASLCATCFSAGDFAFERGNYAQAEHYWNEGARYADPWNREMLPYLWQKLGRAALKRDDFTRAKECFMNSREAGRQNGSPDREGWAIWYLAETAFRENRRAEAEVQLLETMRLFQAIYEPHSIVQCLVTLADWCVSWRQCHRAAALIGSTDRAQEEYRFRDDFGNDVQRLEKAICAEIGPEECAKGRQWGRRLTLHEALDFAAQGQDTTVPLLPVI